jgi:hypothetical protein
MSRARIEVNTVSVSAVNVQTATPVLLSNDDVGDEVSYAWSIVDQPEGAADALSNTTIENPQFTPLKEGTYQLRLVVDAGLGSEAIDTCAISVLRELDYARIPAASETTEASSVKGWALAVNRNMIKALDDLACGGPLITAETPGGLAAGTIVKVSGMTTTVSGLHEVPVITPATGSEDAVRGQLGVIIDGVEPGVLTAGALAIVRVFGIAPIAGAGTPTIGDAVFVDDSGQPSLTAGTYPRVVGRVSYVFGATWRWTVYGTLFATETRTTQPFDMIDSGAAWTLAGHSDAGPCRWHANTVAAAPLLIPLKVHPGEVLEGVVLEVAQGLAAAQFVATLISGTNSTNTLSDPAASAASAGDQVWTPVFTTLEIPVKVLAGEKVWISLTTTGAAATTRYITGATAIVRPVT